MPSFKVISIAATDVTLLWEPVPLFKQGGLILYYQIGVDGQKGTAIATSKINIRNSDDFSIDCVITMAQVDLSSDHDPDYSLERHQQVNLKKKTFFLGNIST